MRQEDCEDVSSLTQRLDHKYCTPLHSVSLLRQLKKGGVISKRMILKQSGEMWAHSVVCIQPLAADSSLLTSRRCQLT